MIISFSGLDGAGKTTQINNLLNFYQSTGLRTYSIYNILPEIRYHKKSELNDIYNILNKYDVIHLRFRLNSDINNYLMNVLENMQSPNTFLAILATLQGFYDHRQLYNKVVKHLLIAKKIIIFDRYYYDELAFKSFYGCPESILKILYGHCVKSNLAFYIKIPSEVCFERNKNRPDGKIPLYKNIKKIDYLTLNFDRIASNKNLIYINGIESPEKIFQKIIFYINKFSNIH